MGEAKKRWSVTYTKHVKQKRKVYQDGFLELHDSSHKIMLYDDCEKLLICRILKNDDVVKSGETLEFNSYLVDIGNLDGDHKTKPNAYLPERDAKFTDKAIHGHKFKRNPVPIDRKPDSGKYKAPSCSLSPSHKIIREFKKNEMNKYGAPRNRPAPDHTEPSYCDWIVLFTTQTTQKAKKYHDGILRVAACGSQGRQVKLYDISRRLLDSRFLKKDEVIGSGESLALDGHLVDIQEPEGGHKPPVDLKVQGRNCTAGGRTGLLNGQQTHCSTIGEPPKSNCSERSIPIDKPLCNEWSVLYTTHITQKAKKYHDGTLRVATCGYQGRQVTLYDTNRRLLDCRFLKKDEVIVSGESLALDGHLVDIGEPQGDHKPPEELKVPGRNCTEGGKTGFFHGKQTQPTTSVEIEKSDSSYSIAPLNGLKTIKTLTREWHALYTSQMTQKAKKYHSGILRLASCNSYQMQATLLNEDGTILSHRFLKQFEDVRSGSKFELPKYLVEVGEPRIGPEGELSKSTAGKDMNFCGIDVDHFKLERRVPIDNPLRDASGILSILKKTMTREGSASLMSTSRKECHALQSSELIQFNPQHQVEKHLVRDSNWENSPAADNYCEETSKTLKPETLLPIQITQSADFENIEESQLKCAFTSSTSVRSRASDVSSPTNPDADCTDKSSLRPVSSFEKHRDLDAFKWNCPDNFPPLTASVPHDGTRGDFLNSLSSNVSSSCHGNSFSEELNIGTSPPPEETRWQDGDFFGGITKSNGCTFHDPSDSGRQNSKEKKTTRKVDEIPSFDLGF